MKHVLNRVVGTIRSMLRLLGLSAIGALIVAGIVALRHMLETPQPLESLLPGEAHLYRWKHGHIFYKVAGKPEKPGAPPMVLLHTPELAASGYEMRGIMPLLAAHYRVYALDLLGFGLSDRPDIDYSADLYTQLCQDFLAQVVKQPATILASRLSCNYAVAVAATTPNLCERLALISPIALFGDQPEETRLGRILPAELLEAGPVKSLLYPLLVEITRLMTRSPAPIRPAIQPDAGAINRAPTAGRKENDAPFDYTYATTHQFGAEHASMALLAGKLVRDVSREIEKVQQPTLIIWGAEDLERTRHIAAQPDQHGTFWGAKQTQIALLQKAGRAVHEELPEVVAETLLQWSAPIRPAIQPDDAAGYAGASTFAQAGRKESEGNVSQELQTSSMTASVDASGATGASHLAKEPSSSNRTGNRTSSVEAYCMKCKKKTAILNAHEITMKNGRLAVQGVCAECGAQLFRMGRLIPGYPQTPV